MLKCSFTNMVELDTIKHPIILFDGICNYCNNAVNFSIKWNKNKNLRFATLQSELAKELLAKYNIHSYSDSIVLIEADKVYFFSTAVLKIAKHLAFPISILSVFIIVPPFIRNAVYKWIAKNRYRWFGKREICIVPDSETKKFFLS